MIKKLKLILLLFSLSTTVFLMNHTYSKYVASSTSNIDASVAKWQIYVNNEDITNNNNATLSFSPVIEENEFVRSNHIAPSSKGYFDIEIDATNTDVAFKYNISLSVLNEELPDLIISKYTIIPENYADEPLELIAIQNGEIENNLYINDLDEKFTVRIYFEWINDEAKTMTDEEQTEIGIMAQDEDFNLIIEADIYFEQIFN